jgi:hypothetical protein
MFKVKENRQMHLTNRVADAMFVCIYIMPQIKEKTP